jgi:SAM-dependent methyltransferase
VDDGGPDARVAPEDLSQLDKEHLGLIRANVRAFLASAMAEFGRESRDLLDIAPQDHAGLQEHVPPGVVVSTLDIDPSTAPTFVADLCATPTDVPAQAFDIVACTEVLEHTLDPFAAVGEIRRVLRPGGHAFVSTPFNFRIHGPLPDCWRFTEHGLRSLFRGFDIVRIDALATPDRPLMPIHYTLVARRPVSGV